VGTPADLALIRMQADATLPLEQRRHYTGVFNALARITKEEGFMGLFKGCAPVVVRAMALNAGQHTRTRMGREWSGGKWGAVGGLAVRCLTPPPRLFCLASPLRHARLARPGPG
jgi:solute carrier family 25 oxoglutarate transporter 11